MAIKRTDKKPDPVAVEKFLSSGKEDLAEKKSSVGEKSKADVSNGEPIRKYTIKIPDSICKKLKIMAVQENKYLYELISEAIEEKVK
jgi:predicted HicB family RNase H-like nuclease